MTTTAQRLAALESWRAARTDLKDQAVDAATAKEAQLRFTGDTAESQRAMAAEAALSARLAKMEAGTVPTGIPPLPPLVAGEWRKDFADGLLAPFRVLTYPDQFPNDNMEKYNRFAGAAPTVHDGYLDLRATRRADGLWNAMLVGTSQDGTGATFGYGRFEICARANVGRGTGQSGWLYDTTTWTSTEIDWPEMLESQQLSAHVIGAGAGKWYGAPPADWATAWHTFSIDRRPGYVAFGLDGIEKARVIGAMPATPLAILLDSKLGFPWAEGPDATTPNPTWLQVASVRVLP